MRISKDAKLDNKALIFYLQLLLPSSFNKLPFKRTKGALTKFRIRCFIGSFIANFLGK